MKRIQKIIVNVTSVNLAAIDADAIVVPEFQHCALYSGIGRTIAKTYPKGMRKYDYYAKAAGSSLGSVMVTETGSATCKHLLHAVILGCCREDLFACIKTAVGKALALADENGAFSVAIPALGTGIAGYLTVEQSAKAVFTAIAEFAPLAKSIRRIDFAVALGAVKVVENILQQESYLDCETEIDGKKFGEWIYTLCNQLNSGVPEVGC